MSYILLVEDTLSIRYLYKVNLQQRGFEVAEVQTGEMALELITDKLPLLMLLDLGLPQINGLELLNLLAQEPAINGFPVIVISAWAKEQVEQIMATYPQVVDALAKPVAMPELITAVQRALSIDV